jgi:hypothetical protein
MTPRRILVQWALLVVACPVIAIALPASTAAQPASDKVLNVGLFNGLQSADSWYAT